MAASSAQLPVGGPNGTRSYSAATGGLSALGVSTRHTDLRSQGPTGALNTALHVEAVPKCRGFVALVSSELTRGLSSAP